MKYKLFSLSIIQLFGLRIILKYLVFTPYNAFSML